MEKSLILDHIFGFDNKVQRLCEEKSFFLFGLPYRVKIQSQLLTKVRENQKRLIRKIIDGKEITLTLEDALFSMESMALMHGAASLPGADKKGTVAGLKDGNKFLLRTARCLGTDTNGTDLKNRVTLPTDITEATDVTFYGPQGEKVESGQFKEGEWYIAQWKVSAGTNTPQTIEISASSFPGTYRIVGTTYARDYATGTDKFFEFEVPMAKMDPAQTITMQADGDPSTFSMTMKVLRPSDGVMMRLTAYPEVDVNGVQTKYSDEE